MQELQENLNEKAKGGKLRLFLSTQELKQMSMKTTMWLNTVEAIITDDTEPLCDVLESMKSALKEQKHNSLMATANSEYNLLADMRFIVITKADFDSLRPWIASSFL